MRTLLSSSATAVALFTLTACGGGGDAAPAAPPAPPPPPSAAMHQQAVALAEAVFALTETATAPMYYGTDDAVVVLAPSAICASGSATLRLDGSAPTVGAVLPVGNHVFDGSFASCAVAPGITLTGAASVSYAAPTSVLTGITATGTANAMRWQGVVTPVAVRMAARTATARSSAATGDAVKALATGVAVDYTANGGLAFAYNESTTAGVVSYDNLLRPAAGATLLNNASRGTLTFAAGEVRETTTANASTGAFLTYSMAYRGLTFSVGGSTVVVDGTLTKTFSGNAMTPGGQATVQVGGAPVGTLRFAADGRLTASLTANVPTW
ncbi:MAG: hypothetical protein MUC68_06170 [Burkholderiaceae bacterium]|jgi:predicted small lipoprotein YifL|nr:hypothetical protein [Burkholderiaceae bacterium]